MNINLKFDHQGALAYIKSRVNDAEQLTIGGYPNLPYATVDDWEGGLVCIRGKNGSNQFILCADHICAIATILQKWW